MKKLAYRIGCCSKRFRLWYYQKYGNYWWGISRWIMDTGDPIYD